MENQQEQPNPQKEEKIETDNKKPISSDIEPIEKIQPSHKIISNFDKKKNFHQNKGHFHNYHQNHNNNYSSCSNSNLMGKNRTNSEKYNRIRYSGSNYNKNNYNDPRNKNYKFAQKKEIKILIIITNTLIKETQKKNLTLLIRILKPKISKNIVILINCQI